MSTVYTLPASDLLSPTLAIPLTAHHIRVTVQVTTPLLFHDFKGSALRGAFVSVLRRTFCPEWRAERTDAQHRALCPICQLLALENDESIAGDVRRPYALTPPPGGQNRYAPGETFAFGLTLFGSALNYLPYLILALGGMGEVGLGQKGANGQRGGFVVTQLDAINPRKSSVHFPTCQDRAPASISLKFSINSVAKATTPTPQDRAVHSGRAATAAGG